MPVFRHSQTSISRPLDYLTVVQAKAGIQVFSNMDIQGHSIIYRPSRRMPGSRHSQTSISRPLDYLTVVPAKAGIQVFSRRRGVPI
jgi:hypothetical protein